MKISVIIPVYNEESTLAQIVHRVSVVNCDKEIVIVDDCSSDSTSEIIRQLAENHPHIIFSRHTTNKGKGAAIQTGLGMAAGEVIIVQDADLEYHPEDYPAALRLIEMGWADAVYGSRFLGPHRVFFYWHYVANKALTWMVNIVADSILTDMETGFKMFRREALQALDIQSHKFDFEVEVTIKLFRHKYRVYEIPITYTGRDYSAGKKITWRDGFHALYAIAKWSSYRPQKKEPLP